MTFSDTEIETIQKMLPDMGAFVADKGFGGKAFNDLTRDEALELFANTIKIFRSTFADVLGKDVPF